jgi:hypothetical protein
MNVFISPNFELYCGIWSEHTIAWIHSPLTANVFAASAA